MELLPKDGSIVIIDDQYEDAKPLMDILSKNGHPSIYFDGNIASLPTDPLERIRVVFADIQLQPALNGQQYAGLIIEHLNSLISDNNGPYVLIIWSGKTDLYATDLKILIEAPTFKKQPIAFITLDKTDYFKTKAKSNIDLNALREELETSIRPEDIEFIIEKIEGSVISPNIKTFSHNSLLRISSKIKKELKNYKAFELLVKWEQLVNEAATNFTADLASIHLVNSNWDFNFRNTFSRLAYAQTGEFLKDLKSEDFVNAAFKTFNAAFFDSLDKSLSKKIIIKPAEYDKYKNSGYIINANNNEYKVIWTNYSKYELYINNIIRPGKKETLKIMDLLSNSGFNNNDTIHKTNVEKLINSYLDFIPELNTRLLIDLKTKEPFQPGIVFEISVMNEKKRRFLNKTYSKKDKANFLQKTPQGEYEILDDDVSKIRFIELEISPNCDFANNKWIKNRLISGYMIPIEVANKINLKKIDDQSLYNSLPDLKINGEIFQIVFSFKLLKSIDLSLAKKRSKMILFRIKNDAMADIVTRMASHAIRIGLIEFK